ncbi:MAG: M48 family metallopeptidase [Rhodospirillales bacterium]|nr:M48 family metallopeptidase [Rhodospirillales bacterium]
MLDRIFPLLTAALVFAAVILHAGDTAAKKRTFIRDSETENTIRAFAAPVFQTAGLDPAAVQVYLVNDPALNAFVAGGQKLFINTGLLMRSESPGQVIGVIAHETGHIAGGHLSRTHDAISKSSAQQIVAMVLGAAAAIGTRRGDVGAAIMAGGQHAAMGTFLLYSRTQEASADAAAMKYLDATGQSSKGMLDFLGKLADQELLSARHQDPYLRTHPLTRERIRTIANHVSKSPFSNTPAPPAFNEMYARMRAKLLAFLEPTSRTLRRFKETDTSLSARYARAIAYYRKSDLTHALPIIDGLIAERPNDPYFHEFKGQMLFENGRMQDALAPSEDAARMAPHSPLIRLQLARIQLEMNDPALLEKAIVNLRAAQQYEPRTPSIWRNLAIAYGRNGDMGQSALAMAEEAFLRGKKPEARHHATRAIKILPAGSAGALKADDILSATKDKKDKDKKK